MLGEIRAFFDAWGWLFEITGLLISLLTLITALRFRRRLNRTLDRKEFMKEQKSLCKELDGFCGSLGDGLLTDNFLRKIDIKLDEMRKKYSCFSLGLRMELMYTSWLLRPKHCAISDKFIGEDRAYKMQKHINHIRIMLEKECRS